MTENERTDLGLTDAAECSCCASSTASTPLIATEGALQAQFKVEGMTCSHCVASVTEELSALDGVQSVGVELNAGGSSTVTVSSTSALDLEQVRAAIGEAGYSLVDSAS
ncbi:heavy-metal-associated domain-containing protein [Glaciibacter psychrotolerans]|uniref:Copper chaperone CopZ n=1 Tax=Glaciibacter psychrotolerans TaxID=670054 RepID=A0A7Z0J5I4_9MICO|nr:heavy-metal-associated domain-containing protein [Leifsonia psychrotolerans]NYJ18919.1 copper chaperone CopZ [Leifsonia psychrotolerans]